MTDALLGSPADLYALGRLPPPAYLLIQSGVQAPFLAGETFAITPRGINALCAAFAIAALLIYPLGISLPVTQLERLGHMNETSIWAGSISLMTHGHLFLGIVVVFCSVVIPLVKLLGLLLLCMPPASFERKHQAMLYHLVELAGRWGMIDVLLVALIIAAVKLGDMVEVTPGPGVVAFGLCVLLSLLASAGFNPHAIWKKQ